MPRWTKNRRDKNQHQVRTAARSRIHQAIKTEKTHLISTMGVHLASSIISSDVDVGLVDVTRDEDVGWGLEELDTGDGAFGHDTGTVPWLGAPGDGLGFLVTNQAVRVGRAPQAEV